MTRTVPDRVDSVRVNTFEALVERGRECAAVRGDLPSFLAVNFCGIGELMRAFDTLNGPR